MKRTSIHMLSNCLLLLLALGAAQELPAGVEPDGRMVVFYAMPEGAEEPTATVYDVEEVVCEEESTSVDLGDEGRIVMRVNNRLPMLAWFLLIDLTELDIPGGFRDTVMADDATIERTDEGRISGQYPFRLHGQLTGFYGLEVDIACDRP